jgi:hypothetical protein
MPDNQTSATVSHPEPLRGTVAATLTEAQRVTLGHALGDAASAHDEIYCAACDALPGDELCPPCATGSAISGAYLDLGLPDDLVIGTPNYRPYDENRSEQ